MQRTAADAVVLSCELIERFQREAGKDWPDLLSLYIFYYLTARKQRTDRPWALNAFVAKGLHWGLKQVKARKSRLVELGLIENVCHKGKNGRVSHWYVKVHFIWKQSTSIPEIPVENLTTGIFSHPVVPNRQMLEVDKEKCLKSEEEKERGKGELPVSQYSRLLRWNQGQLADVSPENLQASVSPEEIQVKPSPEKIPAMSSPEKIPAKHPPEKIQPKHSPEKLPVKPAPEIIQVNHQPENSETEKPKASSSGETLPKQEYVRLMGERWRHICGLDSHILDADLASNTRRGDNWARQKAYWDKRLAGLDDSQIEAWKWIARFLGVYHDTNGSYPDMRRFLDGWMAVGWKDEKAKIRAYCNRRGHDVWMKNYIDARGEDGREIAAKWLLSAGDYMRWHKRENEDDGDNDGDSWENRPSAGPDDLAQWERRRVEAAKKAKEEERRKRSLDLIARAKVLIHFFASDEAKKKEIIDLLTGYRDSRIQMDALGNDVEKFERLAQECRRVTS